MYILSFIEIYIYLKYHNYKTFKSLWSRSFTLNVSKSYMYIGTKFNLVVNI